MESLLEMYPKLPADKHMALYTRLRLAHSFGSENDRLKCVQVFMSIRYEIERSGDVSAEKRKPS